MIKGIVSSLLAKFSVVALLVAGATAGLVVTGALAGVIGPASVTASASPSTILAQPGMTLDFPMNVLGLPASGPAGESPVEVIEEVVIVRAPSAPVAIPVAHTAVAAPGCVNEVSAAINAIVVAIPGVTTAEQGQVLLAQAHALGPVAAGCVDEAGRVGYAGIDAVGQLVGQVGAVTAQIQALPVVSELSTQQANGGANPAGGILGGVEDVVGGTVGLIGKGLGFFGGMLNFGASPVQ